MGLLSIEETAQLKSPRVTIHGTAGIGKTTLASKMKNPIFLCLEDGLGTLSVKHFTFKDSEKSKKVRHIAKTWAEVMESLEWLLDNDHEYNTLVIDTIDWLEPVLFQAVCDKMGYKSIDAPTFGKGYSDAQRTFRSEFISHTNALRDQKGMMIVNIAHTHIKKFEDPETETYDRYELKLNRKIADLLMENSDIVFFMTYKKGTVKTQSGKVKTSTGDVVLYSKETASYLAKNRYQLDHELEPDWAKISKQIRDNAKANAEGVPIKKEEPKAEAEDETTTEADAA